MFFYNLNLALIIHCRRLMFANFKKVFLCSLRLSLFIQTQNALNFKMTAHLRLSPSLLCYRSPFYGSQDLRLQKHTKECLYQVIKMMTGCSTRYYKVKKKGISFLLSCLIFFLNQLFYILVFFCIFRVNS